VAELTYEWWTRNKAKTLQGETLSAALRDIQQDQKDYKKTHGKRAEYVLSLLGKMRPVLQAITSTRRRCNALLHAETKRNLDELERLAKALQTTLRSKASQWETTMQKINKLRALAVQQASMALKNPTEANMTKIQDLLSKTGKSASKAPLMHKSFQQLTYRIGGEQGSGLWGLCRDMKKQLAKQKKGKNVDVKIELLKADMRKQIKVVASWDLDCIR